MKHANYRFVWIAVMFLMVGCVGAFAQANSNMTGIVTDPTGAVVSGATITLIDTATRTEKSTVSSATGLYEIAGLNPSTYDMTVTAKL